MSRPPRIPPELLSGPFHSSVAHACGLTDEQLRSSCWTRLAREVFCSAKLALTPDLRVQALLLAVPPGTVITGRTAAWLYGVWQPRPRDVLPLDCVPDVSQHRFSRWGVTTRRLSLDAADIGEWGGLRVTRPERTCFGLMAASPLVEAVVHADAFRHASLVTAESLRAYADERPRWPNVRKIRAAVMLSNAKAESPMETRLRMILVLGGLDQPYVNRPFLDAAGLVVARPDISYLDPDLGIEYQGAHHFVGDQPAADDLRANSLLVAGMPILRYRHHAVYKEPERVIADVLGLRPDLGPAHPLDLRELLAGRLQVPPPP